MLMILAWRQLKAVCLKVTFLIHKSNCTAFAKLPHPLVCRCGEDGHMRWKGPESFSHHELIGEMVRPAATEARITLQTIFPKLSSLRDISDKDEKWNQLANNELQDTILPTHELLGGFCTSLKSMRLKSKSQCLGYEYRVNSNGVFTLFLTWQIQEI